MRFDDDEIVRAVDVVLRRARPEDVPAIAALFTETRRTCQPYLPPLQSDEEDREFFGGAVQNNEVWVAQEGTDIVGFLAIRGNRVDHLYISPSRQSRGIGAALLTKAKTLRDELQLWVFQQNHGARQFYQSHGFAAERSTDGRDNEEQLPDVLYRWTSTAHIVQALRILRAGGLVAFPTETVYGLGADATNPQAVAKIFAAKGRPATNPLIVHVSDVAVAKRYTARWTDAAQALAERFWPGPLTLVLPKGQAIAANVTAGGGTVGLRSPDHPLALELLRAFDGPVAAPSANRSNAVSPTTARHVREELGDAIDLVLDGGPCGVGIESTVLDVSGDGTPAILRPGGVSREQIEAVLGPVEMKHAIVVETTAAASPGQQAVHYSPRVAAYRVAYRQGPHGVAALRQRQGLGGGGIGVISIDHPIPGPAPDVYRVLPDDPAGYARELYAAMREMDAALANLPRQPDETAILIEMPPDRPEWAAVRDRLQRATRALDDVTSRR